MEVCRTAGIFFVLFGVCDILYRDYDNWSFAAECYL